MAEFVLDFEEIRRHAGGMHKPIFRVSELTKMAADTPAELLERKENMVRLHAYQGFGELRLPLTQAPVRRVLKELRFTSPPLVQFGEAVVPCGKLAGEKSPVMAGSEPKPQSLGFSTVRRILHEQLRTLTVTSTYQVGDVLWVREPAAQDGDGVWRYAADYEQPFQQGLYFGKPFHMPRAACRLLLRVEAFTRQQVDFTILSSTGL